MSCGLRGRIGGGIGTTEPEGLLFAAFGRSAIQAEHW